MIYLLIAVLLLTAWRLAVAARRDGPLQVVRCLVVAAVAGLVAGGFIGVGARTGMAFIPLANGDMPSFTPAGSLSVVLTFASYGVPLGVIYEALFRRLLREKGLAYGALLMLTSWYPLAHAATQQLTGQPHILALAVTSGFIVALMWLPYGVALEALIRRWRRAFERARSRPAVLTNAAS